MLILEAALDKSAAKMKTKDAAETHPLLPVNGDKEAMTSAPANNSIAFSKLEQGRGTRLKPKQNPLLMWYANSLFTVFLSGGFAVLPSIALGGIFSNIGAVSRGPQFGGMLLLMLCYWSDFWICSYVPKCTFSSLLVLAAIDLIDTWFVRSYRKSRTEWVVVPFIVIASLAFGMLQSVALGLGASTLLFVASFYRAGVVKFIANGLTVRSTIERNSEDDRWLCQHADLIQLLVLQNYLFFGNAVSCLTYIKSMFDDGDTDTGFDEDPDIPPIPKYLILDLSLVTGIDTSAVDVLGEISALCRENHCGLLFAGIPRAIRPALITGGVNPSRTNPHLRFSPDLDAALGRAEDELLRIVGHNEEKAAEMGARRSHTRNVSMVDHGLRQTLSDIDAQHNISLGSHLVDLEKYTTPIEINAREKLNDSGNGSNGLLRGLYFVEYGLIKCDLESMASLTRGSRGTGGGKGSRSNLLYVTPHMTDSTSSIGRLNARSLTVGRAANILKKTSSPAQDHGDHVFRLARIGRGWVIGSITEFVGQDIPGVYTALTPCRVHHLTLETIGELEIERPVLVLHLYKLLSHLNARRQEMTIGQLATMRSIFSSTFSSTAPSKPISRNKMSSIYRK